MQRLGPFIKKATAVAEALLIRDLQNQKFIANTAKAQLDLERVQLKKIESLQQEVKSWDKAYHYLLDSVFEYATDLPKSLLYPIVSKQVPEKLRGMHAAVANGLRGGHMYHVDT